MGLDQWSPGLDQWSPGEAASADHVDIYMRFIMQDRITSHEKACINDLVTTGRGAPLSCLFRYQLMRLLQHCNQRRHGHDAFDLMLEVSDLVYDHDRCPWSKDYALQIQGLKPRIYSS